MFWRNSTDSKKWYTGCCPGSAQRTGHMTTEYEDPTKRSKEAVTDETQKIPKMSLIEIASKV